ncbi:MAG: hypothetical protein ACI9U2_005228, partial [Bradymonadia bacterium]
MIRHGRVLPDPARGGKNGRQFGRYGLLPGVTRPPGLGVNRADMALKARHDYHSAMIRSLGFFIVTVALVGCVDPGPDHPGALGLSMIGDDMGDVDLGPDPPDRGAGLQGDAAPVDDDSQFIVLNDTTTGLGVGATFGSDLDAVTFECPDGRSG